MAEIETSRRNVIAGVAAAGVAVPLLAACGSEDSPSSAGTPSGGSTPSGSATSPSSAPPEQSGIPTADIPVGGGKIFADEEVVVTQPTAGDFKAFSAVCTHNGCLVNKVDDGTIDCPCHFSKFSIEDGSVQGGPAPRSLAAKSVTVTGDRLTIS